MQANFIYGKTVFMWTFIAISVFLAFSCKKNTDEKTAIFNVGPQLAYIAPRPPASPSSPTNIPAMKIVENGVKDTLYLTLDRISGFTYTEGYTYVLKVKITITTPAPVDGDIYSYALIQEVSKSLNKGNY